MSKLFDRSNFVGWEVKSNLRDIFFKGFWNKFIIFLFFISMNFVDSICNDF